MKQRCLHRRSCQLGDSVADVGGTDEMPSSLLGHPVRVEPHEDLLFAPALHLYCREETRRLSWVLHVGHRRLFLGTGAWGLATSVVTEVIDSDIAQKPVRKIEVRGLTLPRWMRAAWNPCYQDEA